MKAEMYFDEFGGIDCATRLIHELAVELNEQDIPHHVCCQKLFLERHNDAVARGWPQGREAVSTGVTPRHIRSRVKGLLEERTTAGVQGRSLENKNLLCVLLDGEPAGASFDVAAARERLRLKYCTRYPEAIFPIGTDEQMRQILEQGVANQGFESGVLERTIKKNGRKRQSVYRVTGQSLIRPRASSPVALADRAYRANQILRRIECSQVFTVRLDIGVRGIQGLFQRVINPDKVFRPIWDFIDAKEEDAKARSLRLGLSADDNAATLIGLSRADQVEDPLVDPLAPLSWAVTSSVGQRAEIWPLVFHLDAKAKKAFEALQPTIHRALEAEVIACQALDKADDRRRPMLLSYGWTSNV